MEFTQLRPRNNNFGKPEWQACDNIHITSCDMNPTEYKSPRGGTTYYHKIQIVDSTGNIVTAQFASGSNSPIPLGEIAVECQVKPFGNGLSYTFKPATGRQQNTGYNNQSQYGSKPEPTGMSSIISPDVQMTIIRGNAANAASRVANDPATFWGMVKQISDFIEKGEMPVI